MHPASYKRGVALDAPTPPTAKAGHPGASEDPRVEAGSILRRIRELNEEAQKLYLHLDKLHRGAGEALLPWNPPSGWRARLKLFVKHAAGIRSGLWHHPPRALRIPRYYRRATPPSPAPTISIVTPSWNQVDYLERTLESVLGQGYPCLEYVVQDAGSRDGTQALLQRYRDRLTHVESRADDGQGHAINLGFSRTTGEIMAYLNSDDVLLPGALNYVARYFLEHPQVDVVYGHRILIDGNDAEVGRWVLPSHDDEVLRWADYVPQESLFWRRSLWERTGARMDESFLFALDWDLLLRFREAGARMVRLPRFLGAFRIHDRSKTLTQLADQGEREMSRLRERIHGRVVTQVEVRRHILWHWIQRAITQQLYTMGLLRY